MPSRLAVLEPLVATRFEEQYGGEQVQVSLSGGIEPAWSRDTRELFYRSGTGVGLEMVAASVQTEPTFAVTARQPLFPVSDLSTATPHRNYDVSPDGTTFAMVRFNPSSRVMVIQNLPALVRKLGGGPASVR